MSPSELSAYFSVIPERVSRIAFETESGAQVTIDFRPAVPGALPQAVIQEYPGLTDLGVAFASERG